MATPAQIAANRSNGKKQRARDNALKHGLAAARPRQSTPELEELARIFAQGSADPPIIELALVAAEAELELTNIKLMRNAWIERAYIFGFTERPGQHPDDITRMFAAPNWRELFHPSITMPPAGAERLAEAIRRALPEIAALGRYEARAMARRSRALRAICCHLNRQR
jgi:hypothetical protein